MPQQPSSFPPLWRETMDALGVLWTHGKKPRATHSAQGRLAPKRTTGVPAKLLLIATLSALMWSTASAELSRFTLGWSNASEQQAIRKAAAKTGDTLEERLERLELRVSQNERTITRLEEELLELERESAPPAELALTLRDTAFELNQNSSNNGFCAARVRFNLENQSNTTTTLLSSVFSVGAQFARDHANPRNDEWADSTYSRFDDDDWDTVPGSYNAPWDGNTWIYPDAAKRAYQAFLNEEQVDAEYLLFYTTSENESTTEAIRISLPVSEALAECLLLLTLEIE